MNIENVIVYNSLEAQKLRDKVFGLLDDLRFPPTTCGGGGLFGFVGSVVFWSIVAVFVILDISFFVLAVEGITEESQDKKIAGFGMFFVITFCCYLLYLFYKTSSDDKKKEKKVEQDYNPELKKAKILDILSTAKEGTFTSEELEIMNQELSKF